MVFFFIFGSKPYNLAVLDLALFEKGVFAGGHRIEALRIGLLYRAISEGGGLIFSSFMEFGIRTLIHSVW